MTTKRKKRSVLTLQDKKNTKVDADDWAVLLKFCKTWNGEVPLTEQNVEELLKAVDIQQDDERRILSFTTPSFLTSKKDIHFACGDHFTEPEFTPFANIAGLDQLKTLTLKGKISYLPKGIGELPNLTTLQISLEGLWHFHEDFFAPTSFSKLKSLDISGFSITSENIPGIFASMGDSLEHLKLSITDSMLRFGGGPVLHSSMECLTKLQTLDLVATERAISMVPSQPFYLLEPSVCSKWTNLESIRTNLFLLANLLPSNYSSDSLGRFWPKLKEATLLLPYLEDSTEVQETMGSAFRIISAWQQKLERLTLVLDSDLDLRYTFYLPLRQLSALSSSLQELKIVIDEKEQRPSISSNVDGFDRLSLNPPLVQVAMQDIAKFHSLGMLKLERCKFVAPKKDEDKDAMEVDDSPSAFTTPTSPRLIRMELIQCVGFFDSKSGACDCITSGGLDLSGLEICRMSRFREELGDKELRTLCIDFLKRCPKLQELDLSDCDIRCLDLNIMTEASHHHQSRAGDLFASCLPKETLRVLELSRNPALSLPAEADKSVADRNILALWHLVACFPLLGFVGKFNILFLGRLGEKYHRLPEYYRIIHHLGLNRARSRVLLDQSVPRGLWPNAFFKAQRAFDDYPNHVIAKNRKEEADAIFNLLKERGAEDIFPTL